MSSSNSSVDGPSDISNWLERNSRWCVAALLLVSFELRVWLATSGGQGFWPDESRYSSAARDAVSQFARGFLREGWVALIASADHLFFKIAGVPIAWWELRYGQNPPLVAGYFGLFS